MIFKKIATYSYAFQLIFFLTACASSFYSLEKRTRNNTVELKTNVSNCIMKFPNAKEKDVNFYNKEWKINSESYSLTYPKLKKRLLMIQFISGDETKFIELKRVPRGGAIFKSISLGLITYMIPLIIDPFDSDFYKIGKNSKQVYIKFNNPKSTSPNSNQNVAVGNSKLNPAVSKTESSSSSTTETDNNMVRLTVSAQGRTKEEAKYKALRDALERAFGTFISSNTQILNDELVKDEIVSVSSGNIQKFEIKSEVQLPDGSYTNVVDVTVSLGKLRSFCESKGINVEFQGGLFAANIKLQQMNKHNEETVIENMYQVVEKIASVGYDFTIEVKEPRHSSLYTNAYDVDLKVIAKFNNNMLNAIEIMEKTISGLFLRDEEIKTLKNQGAWVYPVNIGLESGYLRSFTSIIAIRHLCERIIPYYSTYFKINNGLQSMNGKEILSSKDNNELLRLKEQLSDIDKIRLNRFYMVGNNYDLFASNKRDGYREVSDYIISIPIIGKDMNRSYRPDVYDDREDKYLIQINPTNLLNTEISFPIINTLTLEEISKINEYKVYRLGIL